MSTTSNPKTVRILTLRYALGAAAILLLLSGCGDARLADVTGTVTVDGKPVPEGSIAFFPTGGTKAPTAGATIKDGTYRVLGGVTIGTYRVEIAGSRPSGKMITDPAVGTQVEEMIELVPAKYSKDSQLAAEVKPGTNKLDFQLDSK